MKTKNYLYFFASFLLIISSCKKPAKEPVTFASTTYDFLSAYDAAGTPVNMLKDTISSNLLSFISTTLPDGQNLTKSHPELFAATANNDIVVTQHCDVYITFVSIGTAATNSIAFYTYPTSAPPETSKDISKITYVFPNAGNNTALIPGDKMKIGTYEAGTSIGFVVMHAAWEMNSGKLNNNVTHYCSDDILNPEVNPALRKHMVFINYTPEKKTIVGFEDTDRESPYCDNDFNDVVFYATVVN